MNNIIFDDLRKYIKNVLSRSQAQSYLSEINELGNTPSKYLAFLSKLPDYYIFYAMGLLDYTRMRQLDHTSRRIFKDNAFYIFKAISGDLSLEERKEFLSLYNERPVSKIKLLDQLELLGAEKEDLLKAEPSIQDILTYMFNNHFELYKPVFSRFNASIISDSQKLRDLLGCLELEADTDSTLGCLDVIPSRENAKDELTVCLNRLSVLATAYDIITYYGKEDETILNKFQNTYTFVLNDIFKSIHQNLPAFDEQESVHQRINYFHEAIATSFDLTKTNINSVDQLHQAIFDLTNQIKPIYYSVFNSKQDYRFYTKWFNESLDFTESEAQNIQHFRQTTTFKNQTISIDDIYRMQDHLTSLFLLPDVEDETVLTRSLFGAVQSSDTLYLTGYLSPLEYSIAQNVETRYLNSDEIVTDDGEPMYLMPIDDLQQQLSEESYPIYLQFSEEDHQFFNSLLSVSGIYYTLINPIDNLDTTQEPFNLSQNKVKQFFENNAFNAEIKMTELMVSELKRFDPKYLDKVQPILAPLLDAYWGETLNLFDQAQQSQKTDLIKRQMKVNKEILGQCDHPLDFNQRLPLHLKMIDALRDVYLCEYQHKPPLRNKYMMRLDNCMGFFLKEFNDIYPDSQKIIINHQNAFDIDSIQQKFQQVRTKE